MPITLNLKRNNNREKWQKIFYLKQKSPPLQGLNIILLYTYIISY